MRETTEWHAWSSTAASPKSWASTCKGSQVYVEGSLRTRKWTDQSGVEKYSTEIRADQMQMPAGRQGMGGQVAGQQGGYDDGGYGDQGGGGYEPQAPAAQPCATPAALVQRPPLQAQGTPRRLGF